ncbi:MAG: hypothetical protein HY544_02510 [Candidatus Diapherotrites archaeon]|uniref:Dihydrofolate reductase n=1 Tax=Candidatus Iainarchaeum sp. TaxID=3101447 RepID=A0A8T3YM29_9ARCH|nr:hypothetical protein [Candidatus Diapherotrites archaeon]
MKRKYSIVAATTLDGCIARYPGHKSGWTSKEDKQHLHSLEDRADVLLLASRTYNLARKFLRKRNCLIMTRKVKNVRIAGKKEVYINPSGKSIEGYVREKGYKKICVLGGRAAYDYCMEHGLVDDIYLTIEPIAFGSGIGMFSARVPDMEFILISMKKLNSRGTLLLHYRKK